METFLQKLKKHKIILSTTYYGLHDLATSYEINSILSHKDIFLNFYEKYQIESIDTIDDYCVYLFSKKFISFENLLPYLVEENHKTFFETLIEESKELIQKIDESSIVLFLNTHYREVFDDCLLEYNIYNQTLQILFKYERGIDNSLYEFLITAHPYLILRHYENFRKRFERDEDLFKKLIPDVNPSNLLVKNFDIILSILQLVLQKTNSNLKSYVENIVEHLYLEIGTIIETVEDHDISFYEDIVRYFYHFLHNIKSKHVIEFTKKYKLFQEKLDHYLELHGETNTYEITNKKLKKWTLIKDPILKLLYSTHEFYDNNLSSCKSPLTTHFKRNCLVDFASSNIPTDDYFSHSHQIYLDVCETMNSAFFIFMFQEKQNIEAYTSLLRSAISFIEDTLNAESNSFKKDMELLSNMLIKLTNLKEQNSLTWKIDCYTCSIFLSGLIEKLLRVTYEYFVNGKIYFPVGNATLTQILNDKAGILNHIFNENHKKNILFFLTRVGEYRIGKNYRNNLAHLANNVEEHFNLFFVAKMLWLFTDIVNSVLYFCVQELE